MGRLVLRNIAYMDRERFENYVCYLTPRIDLAQEYIDAGFVPFCLDHRKRWHGIRTIVRLVKLLRQLRIDLVHTNHTLDRVYLGLAAALCGIPVVTTVHDTTIPAERDLPMLLLARVRALAAIQDVTGRLWTRRFIAVSDAVREIYTRYRCVPRDRVDVLYSGVALEEFGNPADKDELAALRQTLGIEHAYPVLINVGRLADVKGQVWLIRMMPQVLRRWPQARLIIVGEGLARQTLEQEVCRLGLGSSVSLVGQRSDVRDLLALSDLFVFSSISEGLGLALLEAAAAGKPVVASNCGPIPEVIEHGGSGYLVDPGNSDALAEGVQHVLESPERAVRMGERARQIVQEKFDIRSSVRGLERIYLSILEPGGGAACSSGSATRIQPIDRTETNASL